MKLAVIDIGSNAARLLITEVIENKKQQPVFNKLNLIRVPLRLGFDVFETGIISTQKIDMLIQTLKAFRHLLNAYQVAHIKACATSAMRDAKNAIDIIARVKKETGINLRVSGMPYIRTLNAKTITDEIGLFIGAALLVTSLLFFYFFRSFRATLVSLIVVIIGVMWSFGIMGGMGYEITVLTALVPTLVIVIGIPNCIFFINK